MQSKIDQLISAYESVVNEPWASSLSGQERIWFLVYDPLEQRKVDLRIGDFAIDFLIAEFEKHGTDDNTLIAVRDISSLFGFNRMSDVLSGCSNSFKGRMLLFFPGEYDKNQYRLLDARDGWNYLARPITA